jgi:membrane protease YdiL (CAAX protease family)
MPLQEFLADPAVRGSVLAWASMVLVLPVCEELVFRGALYAGLRRLLHPALAVAFSAALFGAVHERSVMLPAAALGAVLALLYERTGSLAAPIAFHALHNGVTLLVAVYAPGMLA